MTYGIDRMMFALVRRDLEGLRDGSIPARMCVIVGFSANTAGSNQPDGVFEVRLSADVREEVAQAALAEEVDVQLKGAAEPGDADDFPAGADRRRGPATASDGRPILASDCPRALEDHVGAIPFVNSWIAGDDIVAAAIEGKVRPNSREIWHDSSRTSTVMSRPAPHSRAICKHSSPMLPWPKIATVSATRMLGRFDCRHAVAERLQTRRLAVGDAVVHLHQRDFRQASPLGEAAGQVEANDRPLAAQVAALRYDTAGTLRTAAWPARRRDRPDGIG